MIMAPNNPKIVIGGLTVRFSGQNQGADVLALDGVSLSVAEGELNGKRPATAMVFQSAAVFPWMTVLDNVAYGLRTQGVPFAQRNSTAREWAHRVKLERFMEAYPHQL